MDGLNARGMRWLGRARQPSCRSFSNPNKLRWGRCDVIVHGGTAVADGLGEATAAVDPSATTNETELTRRRSLSEPKRRHAHAHAHAHARPSAGLHWSCMCVADVKTTRPNPLHRDSRMMRHLSMAPKKPVEVRGGAQWNTRNRGRLHPPLTWRPLRMGSSTRRPTSGTLSPTESTTSGLSGHARSHTRASSFPWPTQKPYALLFPADSPLALPHARRLTIRLPTGTTGLDVCNAVRAPSAGLDRREAAHEPAADARPQGRAHRVHGQLVLPGAFPRHPWYACAPLISRPRHRAVVT